MLSSLFQLLVEKRAWFFDLLLQHIGISFISITLAALIGLSLGIAIAAWRRGAKPVLALVNFVYTIPSIALFGFLSEEEKVLFEKLIGVSKVGPKMALAALSTFSPAELADAIASQDIARVSHIPGVGKKTAERIILELKGTLDAGMESLFSQGAAESARSAAAQGATEALLSMGFTSAEAEVALKGAPEGAGEGALLQYALKRLGSR